MQIKNSSILNGFDSAYYLLTQFDVAVSATEPPAHVNTFGWQDGRWAAGLFDSQCYPATNPDVAVEKLRKKDSPTCPRLVVSLFDSFSLACPSGPIAVKNKKVQALFAYLLLSPSPSETRERLCGLLWSESEEHKARASLRQTLHQMRETLSEVGFDGFCIGRDEVRLDKSRLDVDVWSVVEKSGADVHPLLLDRKRLPDTLLPGFDEIDPSFRSWLFVQRQVLHEKVERQLEDALIAAGPDLSLIKPIASALLNLEPTHEEACRRLMQSHVAGGDVAGALRAYKTLWGLLEAEYDVEPSAETQALVVEIKRQNPYSGDTAPAQPVVKSVPDIRQHRVTEAHLPTAGRFSFSSR